MFDDHHVNPSKLIISFENSNNHHVDSYNSNDKAHEDYSLTSEIINFTSSSSSSSYKDDSSVIPAAATTRSPLQAQEHVFAERKRRQNLSQLFISLSKVVPGLKKLDKASLLEDGINYLKALEERVRVLEEKEEETSTMKKEHSIDTLSKDDNSSSSSSSSSGNEILGESSCVPEIQARILDKQVLIKVLCKKDMEFIMSRIGGELDKMHLNVMDLRIMPFGLATLHITILAQMQSEFKGTVKDVVDHLHTVFLNPS